eukprot:462525_1
MPHKSPQDLNKMLPNSSKLAQDFVSKLLIVNPKKRPKISTAIKHLWMKEFARPKDYRKCPVFNISFEYEACIKTSFGVRHMMYEELNKFHRLCVINDTERFSRYKLIKSQQLVTWNCPVCTHLNTSPKCEICGNAKSLENIHKTKQVRKDDESNAINRLKLICTVYEKWILAQHKKIKIDENSDNFYDILNSLRNKYDIDLYCILRDFKFITENKNNNIMIKYEEK